MKTPKILNDDQLEQVTGGTGPIIEGDDPSMAETECETPSRVGQCPYCRQYVPFSWWDEHMDAQHPGKPIPDWQ